MTIGTRGKKITMISTYFNAFISGHLNPFWTHLWLLLACFIAEIMVAVGILLESWPPKNLRQFIATVLVVVGVLFGIMFTLSLFVFDEGISSGQQQKIAELENRLASRHLSTSQQDTIGDALKSFTGKRVVVGSYGLDIESALLGNQIMHCLKLGGVEPFDEISTQLPSGSITTGVFIFGPDKALITSLLAALNASDIQASDTQTMEAPLEAKYNIITGFSQSPLNFEPDATVMVGLKPVND
jgi:hypothetical protein